VVLVVNKIDRPDARPKEVVDEVYELFLDLDADEEQIEFPIVYCNARAGRASLDRTCREQISSRCSRSSTTTFPANLRGRPSAPGTGHELDASAYVGRLAICRVVNGTIRRGQQVACAGLTVSWSDSGLPSCTCPRVWTGRCC